VHLLLYGNCFIEKVRDETGMVDELWALADGGDGEVVAEPASEDLRVPAVERGGGVRELDDEDLLHIFSSSIDGITG
jgi:phage portal protein BeeE